MCVCVCVCVRCVRSVTTSILSFSELFPIQMEGVKLTVNKGLSNHFQVSLPGPLFLQGSFPPIPLHLPTQPFYCSLKVWAPCCQTNHSVATSVESGDQESRNNAPHPQPASRQE